METNYFKDFSHSRIFLIILFAIIAISLYLMQTISSNSTNFSHYYFYLLIFNIVLVIILLLIILNNIYQLIKQVIIKANGVKLKIKLSGILVFVSIVPLSIFFIFSIQIINQSIKDWFDVRVDRVIEDALQLSDTILTIELNNRLREVNQAVNSLQTDGNNSDILINTLEKYRSQIRADELTLLDNKNSVVASASGSLNLLPKIPEIAVFDYVKAGNNLVNIAQISQKNRIQVLVPIPNLNQFYLYALFPLSEDIANLSNNINDASIAYEKLIALREPLQESLIINLFLALLLALFSSIFAALRLSEKFILPISDLALATEQITQGNYDIKLKGHQKDELGFLMQAFELMVKKIKQSNKQIHLSKNLLEERNSYLQDLLANMSSGVLSIDLKRNLIDYNKAANNILDIDFGHYKNTAISQIIEKYPHLSQLIYLIDESEQSKYTQLELKSDSNAQSNRVLICKVRKQLQSGSIVYLLIFDDVTNLLEAQRESAWSEVAKRMAHEIKNPLTPIQLSAERISRKFAKQLNNQDSQDLQNLTTTINNQVLTIKKMVEAFVQYAKNPQLNQKNIDIHQLIKEVGNLYAKEGFEIQYQFKPNQVQINGDEDRLRQLFNNLFKNSIESIENRILELKEQNFIGKIKVRTLIAEQKEDNTNNLLIVHLSDNGLGIEAEILEKIFTPYVSSKIKGTGLGMAIVRKIIEEHNAKIQVKNLEQTLGAEIILSFPLLTKT